MTIETVSVGRIQHSAPTFALHGRIITGYVPELRVAGYQTPGWEEPMPLHFFKGEAIR